MRRTLLSTVLVALSATSGLAASVESDAFVSTVRLDMTFLRDTSALAGDRSDNAAVRAVADDELQTQPPVLAALERHMGPVRDRPEAVAMVSGDVVTGRSVAAEPVVSPSAFSRPLGTGASMPAAFLTVDRLAASRGDAFDALYATAQTAVLGDLKALLEAYAQTGDDPALTQIARQEAVKVGDRLAALSAIRKGEAPRD